MNNIYHLQEFGIELPIELNGNLSFLKFERGLPTVFLFDEHHGNLNNCIDNNIVNAIKLIKCGNVTIVGVESHAGGQNWDQYDQEYIEGEYNHELLNTCPQFTNSLLNFNDVLFGVECRDMLDKIQCDLSISDNIHYGNPVSLHPLNKDRSKHFIKTLFEHWNSKGSTGNLILNCGLNHNNHIVEFIEDDHIENITGVKANYIRLNTIK